MLEKIKINWSGSFATMLCCTVHFKYLTFVRVIESTDGDIVPIKQWFCEVCRNTRYERASWKPKELAKYVWERNPTPNIRFEDFWSECKRFDKLL